MAQEEFLRKILRIYPWFFIILIFSFIVLNGFYSIYVSTYISPPGQTIYIPPQSSMGAVTNALNRANIVRSSFYLKVYLYLSGQAQAIKAGYYNFQGDLNIPAVAKMLVRGGRGIKIAFPDGLSLIEVQGLLNQSLSNKKIDLTKAKLADFSNIDLNKYFPATATLEGFLAPDTYEFFPEETTHSIEEKFLANFSKKFLPLFLKNPGQNFYQNLIIASLVEKEAKNPNDMRVVAGIIEKRLANHKPLQIDSSIAYVKCSAYPCSWQVNASDLKTNSPYNTYKNLGLPPTPISNPGLDAISAAFSPLKTDYWYYITTNKGQMIFAKTLREQESNINRYLR
ncbi:MAG: endolytic transglycosylase MltG [Patescibacteria group bacterium]|nr:endolytic transglycosylase MltG [Patescibacteria group bacterium]